MSRTTSDVLVDRLIDWGVRVIFGLPGDGINGIMEALRMRQDKIRFIQTRHEEAAAFAACAYAKWTGKLGVCLATTGPGGTHLLTGLYDAKFDRAPVLALTGLPYHDLAQTFTQQDIDHSKVFQDVAAFNQRVMSPDHVEALADLACRTALGYHQVAHLTFPTDLQDKEVSKSERSKRNLAHVDRNAAFHFLECDVTRPIKLPGRFDHVWHLASLASPREYLAHPIETLESGSTGTRNMLEIARRDGARFLLTSTSECYGDPLEHPQAETYWGNVNPVGLRSCYDESKRYAEALSMAYHRTHGIRTNIARIFNTYGPRMALQDGRVVPEFLRYVLVTETEDAPLVIFVTESKEQSIGLAFTNGTWFQLIGRKAEGRMVWQFMIPPVPAGQAVSAGP